MINPSPQYDALNESQFRREMYQRDVFSVSTDRAAPFLLILDEDTQEVVRVTVNSGVLTVTPL